MFRFISVVLICLCCVGISPSKNIFEVTSELMHPEQTDELKKLTELNQYIIDFCKDKGAAFVPIQNELKVDCVTETHLWRVVYAEDWKEGLIDALVFQIYDDHTIQQPTPARPALLLIEQRAYDYKYTVKAEEISKHYNELVYVEALKDVQYIPDALEDVRYSQLYEQLNNVFF